MNQPLPQNLQVKIDDETLKGHYANMMQVAHNREEFMFDFMNMFPPAGVVVARLYMSPGHVKRVVRALAENLKAYEQNFGAIKEADVPSGDFGFSEKK